MGFQDPVRSQHQCLRAQVRLGPAGYRPVYLALEVRRVGDASIPDRLPGRYERPNRVQLHSFIGSYRRFVL